ncbi:phage portal protein [Nocardia panacis]|uniref:Phage portal protein n=1 Tax=Nocardia panacis TaxID=2340916 RepID=A0A3A4KI75_9NOCA|nr:phage portal protein [Nocardia panacis]RJO79319.1 phage portal protein [Nocardia panacis]
MNLSTLGLLSDDEQQQFNRVWLLIERHEIANRTAKAYYEGRQRVRSLDIAIPRRIAPLVHTVVGWAGVAVDVLDERLDWLGWVEQGADYGLTEIYRRNELDTDSSLAHVDSLVYGCDFITVGTGDDVHPLITVESPLHMSGIRDVRTRRLSVAVSRYWDDDRKVYTSARLYLPDQTVYLERGELGAGPWRVYDRDQHNLGRLPVVQMANHPTASRPFGRSEITRGVRGLVDNAVRTLGAMELNREFFSAPRLWATGVAPEQFAKADGSAVTGWEAVIGRMMAIPHDEDSPDAKPAVGQFEQGRPGPYLDYLRGLAQLLSAETAIPPMMLGFATDTAASADAIRAMESRLVKRAERRQLMFGRAWREVGRLALLIRDGAIPADYDRVVGLDWRDAATPTMAAEADSTTKLVQAQILPASSPVTWRRIGLTEIEQRQVEQDLRRGRVQQLVAGLPGAAAHVQATKPDVAQAAMRSGSVSTGDSAGNQTA